ncbi:MAG: hypothetical protein HC932_01675 [Thermales bacterium]|nr:hypothetical protein [Thermales bacterium]
MYLLNTEEVPADGGQVVEVLDNSELINFNPVIASNSEAEAKITNLLFHPLYTIEYPNFIQDNSQPKITPILLKKEPKWLESEDPNNKFKTLQFELKDNLKWSNDKPITMEDIAYSFERVREGRGNQQFKTAFKEVSFNITSPTSFTLTSSISNPQLLYSANFSPISKTYFDSQITDRLITDERSFKPLVTSGYYTFTDDEVINPNSNNSQKVANPVRDSQNNTITSVILTKNPIQNHSIEPKIEKYIFNRVDSLFTTNTISNSLEKEAKEGDVDLYSRFLGTNLTTPPKIVSEKISLNQKIIPTNTYYNLYLNMQVGNYFINQSLRKYVICSFLNYQPSPAYQGMLTSIPKNKRIIPIQLDTEFEPDCPAEDNILDKDVYQITTDEQSQTKKVLLRGSEIKLSLLGIPESEPLLTDIQQFFLSIGLPTDVIKDPEGIENALRDKSYLVAFLPISYVSQDPYPIFGANGENLSNIRANNRVSQDIEDNLLKYSLSELQDKEAQAKIIQFFQSEYVAINLFQANYEYNYSNRVRSLGQNLPLLYTFPIDTYSNINIWFTESKREFK